MSGRPFRWAVSLRRARLMRAAHGAHGRRPAPRPSPVVATARPRRAAAGRRGRGGRGRSDRRCRLRVQRRARWRGVRRAGSRGRAAVELELAALARGGGRRPRLRRDAEQPRAGACRRRRVEALRVRVERGRRTSPARGPTRDVGADAAGEERRRPRRSAGRRRRGTVQPSPRDRPRRPTGARRLMESVRAIYGPIGEFGAARSSRSVDDDDRDRRVAVVAEREAARRQRPTAPRDRAVQPQRRAAVAVVDDLDLAQVDRRRAAAAGRSASPTRPS